MLKTTLISFILLYSTCSIAYSKKHLERLKNKKDITYKDLAHENPGCPENSECSASNGKKVERLEKILKKYSNDTKFLAFKLEKERQRSGIPVNFLAIETKELKQSADPIIWDSKCKHHRLEGKPKIIKATKFLRNNPKSEKFVFTKVKTKGTTFEIPYGDNPLMIWKNSLIVMSGFEDFLYQLSIGKDGKWKVIYVPSYLIKKARVSKNDVQCEKRAKGNEYFLGSFCTKIWNEDNKDYQIIEQDWACP